MSIALMTRVWQNREPREAADRLMLLALADNANEAGVCWPSVATLARKCGVEKRAALDTLARLEDGKWIVVERANGRGNRYRLTLETGAAYCTGAVDRTGAVDDTGTGAVHRTGPVQSTAPEPSRTQRRTSSSSNARVRAASVGAQGDGAAAAVLDEDGEWAVGLLVARGIEGARARALAVEHGAARVDAVVGRYDREGSHGPGWIVAALRDGYATEVPSAAPGAAPVEPLRNRRQCAAWLDANAPGGATLDEHFEPAGEPDADGVQWYRRRAGKPDGSGVQKKEAGR